MRTEEEIKEQIDKLKAQIKNRVGNAYILEIMINILSGRDSSIYSEFGKLEYREDPTKQYLDNPKQKAVANTRAWLNGENIELYA